MSEEQTNTAEKTSSESSSQRDNRGGDNRGGDRKKGNYRQKRIQIPKFVFRKKRCRLCKNDTKKLDYKDIDFVGKFVSDRGKIIPRRISGCCAKHQRMIKTAVKRARYMALLPFIKVEKISK